MNDYSYHHAAEMIRAADHVIAFTGAGISVESGIPPFRGEHGIWNKYDPQSLEINYFLAHPAESWQVLKEIFYDFLGAARPNAAHLTLAHLESIGFLQTVITQNIDNLHLEAGSRNVLEFHGNYTTLACLRCERQFPARTTDFSRLPPACSACGGLLKPNLVFFGEAIPEPERTKSFHEAEISDVVLIIGSTGEVLPAALVPRTAKQKGARIIEINVCASLFTGEITDVFLQASATEGMKRLKAALELQEDE